MKLLNYIALTIAIIGAVNWGLIGILNFDLVAFIFGEMSWLSRVVYTLVGLSGIYLITFFGQLNSVEEQEEDKMAAADFAAAILNKEIV